MTAERHDRTQRAGIGLRVLGLSSVGALALAALALPANAREAAISFAAPPSVSGKPAGFTPARADPRLLANADKPRSTERLSFTRTGVVKSKDVSVRVTGKTNRQRDNVERRVAEVAQASRRVDVTPSDYNLGVDVGWKRLGVSGEVSGRRGGTGALVDREGAVVGVSYDLGGVTPRVSVSADREMGRVAPAINPRENVALDVGTAVKLSRNIAITGGVRYRIDRDRAPDPDASRVDSQAVYVGTKLKF